MARAERRATERETRRRRRTMAALSGTALVSGGLVAMEAPATALDETFVVSTLLDSGPGSLRQAVLDANATLGADTIVFDGVAGTITLAGVELAITDDLTITGPGAGALTVSGDHASRIVNIDDGVGAPDLTVEISGLTLADGAVPVGESGGAIRSNDHLTVRDSVITGSGGADVFGGGISSSYGSLTIERSTISANNARFGGGVSAGSDLTVVDSIISGNTAASGGGIDAYGSITIERSTIAGNDAANDGGGLYTYFAAANIVDSTISGNTAATGGGIAPYGGSVTIERSSIWGNQAATHGGGIDANYTDLTVVATTISGNTVTSHGGGVAVRGGTAAFRHATITDNNPGGIWSNHAAVTLDHSIVTGSRSWYDLQSTYDAITYEPTTTWAASYSLVGSRSYADVDEGSNLLGARARLGPLADNGGPTLTHLPASSSPAVDAGDPDTFPPAGGLQRGETAVVGDAIDIGAVERGAGDPGPATFEVTSDGDSGAGTLRAAVAAANASPDADTITFDPDVTGQITLTSGELAITDDVAIIGPGARELTVSGNHSSRVFYVDDDYDAGYAGGTSDVVITGLTLADGFTVGPGGAILSAEDLTLRDTTVTSSQTDGPGGGIASGGNLTIERSTISGNASTMSPGGGIFTTRAPAEITSSTISGNTANRGGALFADGGAVTLRHVTITANTATFSGGGAVYLDALADGTADHAVVSGNTGGDVNPDAGTWSATWSSVGPDADLALGPLANNGGATDTHLPATGSSLIDAGDPAFAPPPATDQRGETRVQHGRIDIGAVETAAPPPPTTTTIPAPEPPEAPTTTTTAPPRESITVTIPSTEEGAPAEVSVETDAGTVELRITGAGDGAEVTVTTHRADQLDGSTRGITVLDTVFDVEVTGGDADSVTACFPYTDAALSAAGIDESSLQLFHYRDDGTREVVESTIDTANNQICGTVDSLSPFALGSLRTTRLAGEDECGTAAEVSAASFEPGADTVYVTSESAYADALAAGPAAAAAGAPFVLVHTGEVPDVSMDELVRLAPRRIVVVGGSAAVSDDVVATLGSIAPVERIAGDDRYATAAALSSHTFAPGVPIAFVVRGDDFADGLVAGGAAALAGGPVLLAGTSVPDATLAELTRLAPQRIVVVGGTAGVSAAAETELARLAPTSRIAGADRYATAAQTLATFPAGSAVVVASGEIAGDGLTAVSAAAEQDAAVVLVRLDELPPAVADRLDTVDPREISVVGGRDVVSLQVEGDLAEYLTDDES